MLNVRRQYIINPGKVCSGHRTNAWQIIEPESKEDARSNIGVEKARLTMADGSMSHILQRSLATSSGMQTQTLQHDCYVAAGCKRPKALRRTS